MRGRSVLHRMPAGAKLASLGLAGTGAFLVADPRWLAAALGGVVLLAALAGVSPRTLAGPLRAAMPVLLLVVLAQGVAGDWSGGVAAALRLLALMALATLVTASTTAAAMTDAIAAGLAPLRRIGLRPAPLAFALSLALRLLPLLGAEAAAVREAQRARGRDRSLFALAVPLTVRVLAMADELADAIDARGGIGDDDRADDRPPAPPRAG